MSFLDWWRSGQQDKEPSSGSQLDLLGEPQSLPERQELKGTGISRRFNGAVHEKGGDKAGEAMATDAVTRGVMGCSTKELYRATGGKPGKVSSLPTEAQEGLAVGKIAATHALNASDQPDGNQGEINQQIASTSHEAAKKAGGLFPWNW